MRFLLIAICSAVLLLAAPLLTTPATSEPILPEVGEVNSSTLSEESDYKESGEPSYVAQAAEPAVPQQPSGEPRSVRAV